MSSALQNKTIAILATDGVEQVELTEPRKAVEQAGATTRLLSIKDGEIQGMNHDKPADKLKVDGRVADAKVEEFDALILPGGVANPDALRMDEAAVGFVRDFYRSGKPIGVICHGPWVMIEADAVRGRRMTSWPSVRTDLRNAGRSSRSSLKGATSGATEPLRTRVCPLPTLAALAFASPDCRSEP